MDATDPQSPQRVLGLTGPIACGKTTVGNILLELGAIERIDADAVVHDLMLPGTEVTARIAAAFGEHVLRSDGSVDRQKLGAIVFADPAALRLLEGITHPAVRAEIRQRLRASRGREVWVVVDAVKLLQSELVALCEAVWVVTCSPVEQRRRLLELRGMSTGDAERRVAAQPSFGSPRVTAVIDNSGNLEDLRAEVGAAWRRLVASE